MSSTNTFHVEMTCGGCSGAVERVLNKVKGSGVDSFEINLPEKTVTIVSTLGTDALTEILKKTGKEVSLLK